MGAENEEKSRQYPEKRNQALVVAVRVVDYTIDLLERAPSLRHQLHRLAFLFLSCIPPLNP
jgi:hypothetical protein